ncbi:hypothetical protein, partial [[Eubacterium] cellulosolvens]
MVSITCLLIMVSFVPSLPKVAAHSGVFLSAYTSTSPVIDGIIGAAGEWSDADTTSFGPFTAGTETISGTLYTMNNDTDLLIAVCIYGDNNLDLLDAVLFYFDNDHGGETNREQGDDHIICSGSSTFYDYFRDVSDSLEKNDNSHGGAIDGTASASQVAVYENHFELIHPLDSADDAHDFSLSAGDTVGFS